MQCDICFRTGGRAYLCPTDARNLLYEARIKNAQVLIEKDALDREITALLTSKPDPQSHASERPLPSQHEIDAMTVERIQAKDRTKEIIEHADELRRKVESARKDIARRREELATRKAGLTSLDSGIEARRARQIEEGEKLMRMTRYKWNQNHNTTATSRTFLCGEAAKLYGLKRIRRNNRVDEYKIGGISIMNLKGLNSEFVIEPCDCIRC